MVQFRQMHRGHQTNGKNFFFLNGSLPCLLILSTSHPPPPPCLLPNVFYHHTGSKSTHRCSSHLMAEMPESKVFFFCVFFLIFFREQVLTGKFISNFAFILSAPIPLTKASHRAKCEETLRS